MNNTTWARVQEILRQKSGLARTRDFERAGIGRWVLHRLVNAGLIERVKSGLYRLPDMPAADHRDLAEACAAVPQGVVFLLSALAYHGLTTHNPWRVSLAVPNKVKVVLPSSFPIKLHFLTRPYYELGMETANTPAGEIRVYNREKTVCDCLHYRNRVGLDMALEGLRTYLGSRDRNVQLLLTYAAQCRVERLLRAYLEAML